MTKETPIQTTNWNRVNRLKIARHIQLRLVYDIIFSFPFRRLSIPLQINPPIIRSIRFVSESHDIHPFMYKAAIFELNYLTVA